MISSTEPSKLLERGLERLAALEVEVVRRLVEDQDVGARVDEDRQRQPPPLAAREPLDRLLGRLAGEQELAEQRARLVRRQPRGALGGLEHAGGRVELLGVLGEHAELDVVAACAACPRRARARPVSAVISVVLPEPLGPISETCSPRSSHSSASRSSSRSPILSVASSISKTTRPERSGGLNAKPRPLPSRGSRVTRSILSSCFARDCAWRARVPARKRVTKRSSRSISSCWRSIARPSASSRAAFSLRQACQVPLKKLRAAGLELEHRGADRLEEPAVVGDEHDRGVERLQVLLEPLERGDVEVVGRLVEQQQVGVARERAGERRARELAAGEGRERAVEVARRGSRARAASR